MKEDNSKEKAIKLKEKKIIYIIESLETGECESLIRVYLQILQ